MAPDYDFTHYRSLDASDRKLCSRCVNTDVSRACGLVGFEHHDFEPVDLTDCGGEVHRFHFQTRLFGPGVALDAFEVRDGEPAGYRFQVIGDPEGDPMSLLARLIEKMRRALSVKHLRLGDLGLEIADQVVRARIDWDEDEEGQTPLLIVDGRAITWRHFGHMLMSFEGWQFKLEIRDQSEEQ